MSLEGPEWETWKNGIQALSPTELKEEIEREEAEQKTRVQIYSEITDKINALRRQIENEKLKDYPARVRARRERIEELYRVLGEFNKQISISRGKINYYRAQEADRTDSIEYHRSRLRWIPTFMTFEREHSRNIIPTLIRSRAGYRGAITRQKVIDDMLLNLRSSTIGEIGGHAKQLKREETLEKRLFRLYGMIGNAQRRLNALTPIIEEEEAKIEFKRSIKVTWRFQKAREYFAFPPGKDTPVPFAEFRVWVYTLDPDKWNEYKLHLLLNELEFVVSMNAGRSHIMWANAVEDRQSYEERPVDEDEVDAPLDEVQYHAVFYHRRGGKLYTTNYDNAAVQGWLLGAKSPISGTTIARRDSIKQTDLAQWRDKPMPERRLKPRKRRGKR